MVGTSNKEKIVDAIKSMPVVANREGWVLTLDRDEGALFYSPREIPDGVELHQVNDECAVYLDKDYALQGLMVEYYNHNFIKHHPEFGPLTKDVFADASKEREIVMPDRRNRDAFVFKNLLEKTVIAETVVPSLSSDHSVPY